MSAALDAMLATRNALESGDRDMLTLADRMFEKLAQRRAPHKVPLYEPPDSDDMVTAIDHAIAELEIAKQRLLSVVTHAGDRLRTYDEDAAANAGDAIDSAALAMIHVADALMRDAPACTAKCVRVLEGMRDDVTARLR